MTIGPDTATLPVAVACEITDVSRQVRNNWIKRKIILGRTAGACSLDELLELAAFALLVERLGFDDARVAWHGVREECRADWRIPRLELVIDLQLKSAVVAHSDGDVAAAVRHGRLIRVLDIRSRLAIVEEAFMRIAAAIEETRAT
jgi:hypothetical protein